MEELCKINNSNNNKSLPSAKLLQYFTLFTAIAFVLYTTYFGFLYPICGDDFLHSVFAREGKVLSYSILLYTSWTLRLGNILSVLVLHTNKLIFDILNPFIQTSLPIATFFLLFNRLPRLKWSSDCISFLSLLILFWVGCARPRDTVYWVSGATVYSWGMLIVLLFFCSLRLILNLKEKKIPYPMLTNSILIFLGICAGFCNENNTLIGAMIIILALLFFKAKKINVNKSFYYASIGFFLGAALLFSAPGIWERQTLSSNITFWDIKDKIMLLPSVISFCLYSSYISCIIILFTAPLLLGKIYSSRDKKLNLFTNLFAHPQFISALVLVSVSLLLSLVFAGIGLLPAVRAYYPSSVCMAMAAVLMIDLLFRKYQANKIIIVLTTILCCYSAFILFKGGQDFLIIHADQKKREIEIAHQKHSCSKNLHVSQHRIFRKNLFQFIWVEDIIKNKDFWLNKRAAEFYNVNSICCTNECKAPLFFWGNKKNKEKYSYKTYCKHLW